MPVGVDRRPSRPGAGTTRSAASCTASDRRSCAPGARPAAGAEPLRLHAPQELARSARAPRRLRRAGARPAPLRARPRSRAAAHATRRRRPRAGHGFRRSGRTTVDLRSVVATVAARLSGSARSRRPSRSLARRASLMAASTPSDFTCQATPARTPRPGPARPARASTVPADAAADTGAGPRLGRAGRRARRLGGRLAVRVLGAAGPAFFCSFSNAASARDARSSVARSGLCPSRLRSSSR